ncbi:MAG: hypothetical protein M1834_002848 [Cirrosporium novae-zelandiae]|nr:MAG: hypothetical protein M1834_002848 [Cirrosporium novae-zelandiae]
MSRMPSRTLSAPTPTTPSPSPSASQKLSAQTSLHTSTRSDSTSSSSSAASTLASPLSPTSPPGTTSTRHYFTSIHPDQRRAPPSSIPEEQSTMNQDGSGSHSGMSSPTTPFPSFTQQTHQRSHSYPSSPPSSPTNPNPRQWLKKRNTDSTKGTVMQCGRRSNEWLFGDISVTETVKGFFSRKDREN